MPQTQAQMTRPQTLEVHTCPNNVWKQKRKGWSFDPQYVITFSQPRHKENTAANRRTSILVTCVDLALGHDSGELMNALHTGTGWVPTFVTSIDLGFIDNRCS